MYYYAGLISGLVVLLVVIGFMARVLLKERARQKVLSEIRTNISSLQTIVNILGKNAKLFNNDLAKIFEHSKGFLSNELSDEMFKQYKHLFDQKTQASLKNIYKAFAVVEDVLDFVKKINSETEIKTFMEHFRSSLFVLNHILKTNLGNLKNKKHE